MADKKLLATIVAAGLVGAAAGYMFGVRLTPPVPAAAAHRSGTAAGPTGSGEALARSACATCHLFPPPDLLTRREWAHLIQPQMAVWMGIDPVNYEALPDGKILEPAHVYPSTPVISESDWFAIWDYYQASAPSTPVPPTNKPPVRPRLPSFRPRKINFAEGTPMISMLKIDSEAQQLFVGDAFKGLLGVVNPMGDLVHTIQLGSPPVDLTATTNGWYATLIGRVYPSDAFEGKVVYMPPQPTESPRAIIEQLCRPIHTAAGDLNGDGAPDLVVCSFGNRLGKVSWFESVGTEFREHPLLERPGGLRTELRDFDGDGRLDIMVLMSQAREGIYIFFNQGAGRFQQETVLEQHPLFGFANLQLADFNGDGRVDIVTANGDNGDNPTPHKRYHGVRIYLQESRARFQEVFFYPMEGAYKAVAADFDRDGDLDLAAISFYPDFSSLNAMESFVYLENMGNFKFQAATFPERISGRWMTMDAGDLDGDGDIDIVLGSFVLGPTTIAIPKSVREQWRTNGAAVLVLENRRRE